MQDDRTKRGGWFKVEHAPLDLIEDGVDPKRRVYAIAIYTTLVRAANKHRAATFRAMRQEVADAAGVSVKTLDRVVPELAALGLVAVDSGRRGAVNGWTVLSPEAPPGRFSPDENGLRDALERSPRRSTRARPDVEEEQEEKKKTAPDGACSLSGTEASDRVEALLARHADAIERHNGGVRPKSTTTRDRDAARSLAARLGDDLACVDAALAFALADEFYAQHVTSFARFEGMFDKVLAAVKVRAAADADEQEAADAIAAIDWMPVVESLVDESIAHKVEVLPPDGMPDWAIRLYDERIKAAGCANCGRLGHWPEDRLGSCSRVCALQAEYAADLARDDGPADAAPDHAATLAMIAASDVDVEF